MPLDGAARIREFRRREKAGRCIYPVELDEKIATEAAIYDGLISDNQIEDRRAIATAIAKMIEDYRELQQIGLLDLITRLSQKLGKV